MRRVVSLWLTASLLVTGAVGWASVGAQSTPPSGESGEYTSTEYEATISALQTQVAQLEDRVEALSSDRSAGNRPNSNATEEAQGEPKQFSVGDLVEVNDWTLSVTGVELAPTVDLTYDQYVARGIYVIAYLSITNDGDQPMSFPYDDLVVSATNGRTYGYDSDSTIGFQIQGFDISLYEDLQPGLTYESVVVFDVPANATGLALQAADNSSFTVDLGV